MEKNLQVTYFKPEKQGVYPLEHGYTFATEIKDAQAENCGLILYGKNGEFVRIPFSGEGKRGALCGILVEGKKLPFLQYNYYHGEEIYTDPYAVRISGLEKFGDFGEEKRETRGVLVNEQFDWEGDMAPAIPYQDTIIYGLHVRGFTMHKSSGVKHKGTFEGIAEKTEYLKELGITAIELMPAYEFDECMYLSSGSAKTMDEAVKSCNLPEEPQKRLNCWGFQQGFYFAPKASYSVGKPDLSFKKMVKELHKNGIEVLMQFYFPPQSEQSYILDVLKHWVIEYHVDGFRLCGFNIPFKAIARDPLFMETKIRSDYFPLDEIYSGKPFLYRNIAFENGNFRNDMRRFIKGDENLTGQVLFYQKHNPAYHAVINYLADYDGFSLYDTVAYERKHNEANGENNRDGTENNYSWNCGAEGESRKKAITERRLQQIKNGLALLLLAQGVPYLFSGDEMANTRFGNNNAYCHDNEIWQVKWKKNKFSEEVLRFTGELISFRKEHPILHVREEMKVMDSLGCGYPDISYHGMEAWRPDTSYVSRMVGIMLWGAYAAEPDDSLYIACNMHWHSHEFALPKLPKGMKWVKVLDTGREKEMASLTGENKIRLDGRSVTLYRTQKDKDNLEASKKSKRKTAKTYESLESL